MAVGQHVNVDLPTTVTITSPADGKTIVEGTYDQLVGGCYCDDQAGQARASEFL